MRTMRLGRRAALASVVAVSVLGGGVAHAQQTRVGTLSSAQEVAPPVVVVSPGTGFGTVTLDALQELLTVNMTYSNLLAPATGAHIHRGAIGVNGPVAIDFPPNGFLLGLTSGSYSRVFDLSLASTYGGGYLTSFGGNVSAARADIVSNFLAGNSYLNIHSSARPAGEIRGQLQVVPEPSTYVLMATGLLTIGGIAARRRRSAN